MVIQRLNLETSKPRELTEFYRDILGLPVNQDVDDLRIIVRDSELLFKKSSRGDSPFYHFAFNIPCNKIEEAKSWLEQKVELIWMEDYKSDIAEFVNWHARSVYFFDPAGNIVEFIARMDLKNDESEPFSQKQILSISEAGLVFPKDELLSNTESMIDDYQLNYFDKQPPLPQFKALGDDEGLFIIVPANRNWYPTQKPSGIFPMEIDFLNDRLNYKWKC